MELLALENLQVGEVGVHLSHSADFLVDRPMGSGDFLLLRFESPTRLRDNRGVREVTAGTCVLYPPGMTQWYRGASGGLANTYMHFQAACFDLFPAGEAFLPSRSEFLAPLLAEIEREQARRQIYCENMTELLATQLLLLMARAHPAQSGLKLPHQKRALNEELADLRAEIRARPEASWRVDTMAKRLHLSASRFSVLYRAQFGVPPMDDVIEARLAKARYLLLGRGVAVALVARECGFSSPFYFSRLFKSKTGVAPRDYYQEKVAAQLEGE
jgi:AraC-like DNA-binding protein